MEEEESQISWLTAGLGGSRAAKSTTIKNPIGISMVRDKGSAVDYCPHRRP